MAVEILSIKYVAIGGVKKQRWTCQSGTRHGDGCSDNNGDWNSPAHTCSSAHLQDQIYAASLRA
jgi:hypothetical protein